MHYCDVAEQWWSDLPPEGLGALVTRIFDDHPELEVRMRAEQRALSGDVAELRSLVDQVLRTRRYLDWRQTREYADAAHEVPLVRDADHFTDSGSALIVTRLISQGKVY